MYKAVMKILSPSLIAFCKKDNWQTATGSYYLCIGNSSSVHAAATLEGFQKLRKALHVPENMLYKVKQRKRNQPSI